LKPSDNFLRQIVPDSDQYTYDIDVLSGIYFIM